MVVGGETRILWEAQSGSAEPSGQRLLGLGEVGRVKGVEPQK